MMGKPNLTGIYDQLTQAEKQLLIEHLNLKSGTQNYHSGNLPFVDLDNALNSALHRRDRIASELYWKLLRCRGSSKPKLVLTLDDAKVYRQFGPHPERGKPMPWIGKTKGRAGMKWSLPKKQYVVYEDCEVAVAVALVRVAKNTWEVKCAAQYWTAVKGWLYEHCR